MLVSLYCLIDESNLGTHSNLAINDSTVQQFYEICLLQGEDVLQQCQKYLIKNKGRELLSSA